MFGLEARYPAAIHIGQKDLYAVQLRKASKGLRVRAMLHWKQNGEAEEEGGFERTLDTFFRRISKQKGFTGKSVVLNFPSQDIHSFPIRFQVGEREALEEAIIRASKEHLPFPLEQGIIDYPSLLPLSSQGANDYKATVISVHREKVEYYLNLLRRAGLTLEAVDFGVSSLLRLHHYLNKPADDASILFNLGHTRSLLSVVNKENILAQRYIPWGIGNLLDRIKTNLNPLNEEYKARALLKEYGLIYEGENGNNNGGGNQDDSTLDHMRRAVYQIITPQVDELIYEFHKMIGYVRSEEQATRVEGIYMYGEAVSIRKFEAYFERRLNIPTHVINPMEALPPADEGMLEDISEGAPFAMALGLAMRKVSWL